MLIKLLSLSKPFKHRKKKNADEDWCSWVSSALTEIKMQINKEKLYFTSSSA